MRAVGDTQRLDSVLDELTRERQRTQVLEDRCERLERERDGLKAVAHGVAIQLRIMANELDSI